MRLEGLISSLFHDSEDTLGSRKVILMNVRYIMLVGAEVLGYTRWGFLLLFVLVNKMVDGPLVTIV